MSDIFVEVDEALKQERLEKLWHKYGGLVLGFLGGVILLTAFNSAYKAWDRSQNEQQSALYLEASNTGTPSGLTELAPNLRAPLESLSALQSAGLYLQDNQTEKAAEIYAQLSKKKKSAAPFVQEMAAYMHATLSNENAEGKRAALDALISDGNNPWRYQAALDLAVLEAGAHKDFTKARDYLSKILSAENVPQSLKQKAQSLDILYRIQEKS